MKINHKMFGVTFEYLIRFAKEIYKCIFKDNNKIIEDERINSILKIGDEELIGMKIQFLSKRRRIRYNAHTFYDSTFEIYLKDPESKTQENLDTIKVIEKLCSESGFKVIFSKG